MLTSEATTELFKALLVARRLMRPAFKGGTNKHFNYQFANEESWHDAVQPALLDNGLILTFSVIDSQRSGTLTTVHGSARVTHADTGQYLQITGVGEGEDKNDKAAYKAQTGLKKYLYALAFALPTTDDPEDTAHDKRRAADEVEAKAQAAKPGATRAEVNGAVAAAGLDPKHDVEAKARCKALYDQAKVIDKDEARIISKRHGTDYAKIEKDLCEFIDYHGRRGAQ